MVKAIAKVMTKEFEMKVNTYLDSLYTGKQLKYKLARILEFRILWKHPEAYAAKAPYTFAYMARLGLSPAEFTIQELESSIEDLDKRFDIISYEIKD